MLHNSRFLFVLTAFAVLTLTAGADTHIKKNAGEITAKHHLSWQEAEALGPSLNSPSRVVSFPPIQGNSQEALHPKKEKDDSPKPPDFVQKIRDNMAYKVKDW